MLVLTQLEDPDFAEALRELANTRMDLARQAVEQARAESVAAHDYNFTIADRDFRDRERAAVRALLLRTSRACARLHDAVESLEAAETFFLADAGATMRAACDKSHAEARMLAQKLAHERREAEIVQSTLHDELRKEHKNLDAAKALATHHFDEWEACKVRGAAEVAALTACLGGEMRHVETLARRWASDALENWNSYSRSSQEAEETGSTLQRTHASLDAANTEIARLNAALAKSEETRCAEVAALNALLNQQREALEAAESSGRVRAMHLEQALAEQGSEAEATVAALAQAKQEEARELNEEVDRLRRVQQDAIKLGGSGGGTGRQKLFFESMKPRDPKQPSSMSWRSAADGMIRGTPPPRNGLAPHKSASAQQQTGQRVAAWRARASAHSRKPG